MKRKIFSQFSLLLALFTILISLSACSSQTTPVSASNNPITAKVNYNQNASSTNATQISNTPGPRTGQS